MTEKSPRLGFPTRDQLFDKYSTGRDLEVFRRFASLIETRARTSTDGSAGAAYAWLARHNRSLIGEMGAFSPGFLDFGSALAFVSQSLYWEAVASPMDASLLEGYRTEYRGRAFSEGRDAEAALHWLSANMTAITHENVALHPDWKERNSAYGEVHKELGLNLLLHSPEGPGDMVEPRHAPPNSAPELPPPLPTPPSRATHHPAGLPNPIEILRNVGFQEAGRWRVIGGRLSVQFLRHAQARNVLYAFVTARDVMYLGKTTLPLEKRMNGYSNPGPTQRTNIRVRAKIADLFPEGGTLDIWVLLPEPLTYRGLNVSLAAGLEDALLEATSPAWNLLGK